MSTSQNNTKEKVVYGLKNVHYAVQTVGTDGSIGFSTPIPFPGAVNLALSTDGETVEFYADDMIYYTAIENNGYTGDFECANVPDSFKEAVFGDFVSDGLIFENAESNPKAIALLGEFDTDAVAKRFVFYNVICGRPDVSGKTSEKTKQPQTQKMSLKARPIELAGKKIVKASTTASTSDTVFADFFKAVKLPAAS